MLINLTSDRCYIIAEIGGNFTTYEEACSLIDAANSCGVDAIKLQTYNAETICSKSAIFDMENTGVISQYELFKQYEISEDLHRKIFEYANNKRLDWFSTPSHESDVELLERLDVSAYKIGSDDATNIPFLRNIARIGKPVILSTGMCTLEEVKESVNTILSEGNSSLIILHAITSYPTYPEHVNLRAMQTLMREFPKFVIGYSDHTLDNTAAICAVAMGARVIEKHFTCDKTAEGPDHMLSANPNEMKLLVEQIRTYEKMKGDGIKRPATSENITRVNNRKSLVLTKSLKAGECLDKQCLAIKRPGSGIEPKYYDMVIGRTVNRCIEADSVLQWEDLC